MKIKLGTTYEDRITGFVGVATGFVEYISGCKQVLLAPTAKDGEFKEPQWFDAQRVIPTEAKEIVLDNTETPGFGPEAPKR